MTQCVNRGRSTCRQVTCHRDVMKRRAKGEDLVGRDEHQEQQVPDVQIVSSNPAATTGLLTRAQAARLLGVSEATVRRREGIELKPVVRNGVHYHQETQVRSMLTVRRWSTGGASPGADGGVAADVFELLQEGVALVDIVMRLRLTPEVVKRLHEQWAEMRGTFVVSPSDAKMLDVKSAADLLGRIREREDRARRAHEEARRSSHTCAICGRNASFACESCVRGRGPLVTDRFAIEEGTDERGRKAARLKFQATWQPVDDVPVRTFPVQTEWATGDLAEAFADLASEADNGAITAATKGPGPEQTT